tara:strand:+ start:254 stop:742 length:489 start_codon:yes stop_codon:yes gene_type:complete
MKKFLVPTFMICILGLIGCSPKKQETMDDASELEEIVVLFCGKKSKLSLSIDEIYDTKYPWIFNKITGDLYERDQGKNELYPLEVFIEGKSRFVYQSKLNGNKLEIKETEYYPVNKKTFGTYLIDFDKLKLNASFKYSDGYKERYVDNCIRLPLPSDIKIRK